MAARFAILAESAARPASRPGRWGWLSSSMTTPSPWWSAEPCVHGGSHPHLPREARLDCRLGRAGRWPLRIDLGGFGSVSSVVSSLIGGRVGYYAVFWSRATFYCIAALPRRADLRPQSRLRPDAKAASCSPHRRSLPSRSSADGPENAASEPKPGVRPRARLAVIPVATTIISLAVLFLDAGDAPEGANLGERLQAILGGVEGTTKMLFYSSTLGLLVAFGMATGMRILTPREAIRAALSGGKAIFAAVGILFLAWGMAQVCDAEHLGTRTYLASLADQPTRRCCRRCSSSACGPPSRRVRLGRRWAFSARGIPLAVAVGRVGPRLGGMVIVTMERARRLHLWRPLLPSTPDPLLTAMAPTTWTT